LVVTRGGIYNTEDQLFQQGGATESKTIFGRVDPGSHGQQAHTKGGRTKQSEKRGENLTTRGKQWSVYTKNI